MTVHQIRFEGPATLAVSIATDLADARGVALVSSEPPMRIDDDLVGLTVTVEASRADVLAAVAGIRETLADAASLDIIDS